jgi:hypothetical protein
MLEARIGWTFVALVTAATLLGCPENKGTHAGSQKQPSKACTKAYEQCELSTGVRGICDVVDCPPGSVEPCLHCRSQH